MEELIPEDDVGGKNYPIYTPIGTFTDVDESMVFIKECGVCGSLVNHMTLHTDWHRSLKN